MFKNFKRIINNFKNLSKNNYIRNTKNNDQFNILLNGKDIDVIVKTIRSFRDKIDNLIFKDDISQNVGYRFVNRRGISTFGFKIKVDIIICDFNHSILDFYEDVSSQKMTHFHKDAKFIYIFSNNFVKRFNVKINDIFRTKK